MKKLAILFTALAGALFLSNCASGPLPGEEPRQTYLDGYNTQQQQQQQVGYWDGDGVEGPAKIKINLSQQKAYFYKGNQLVGQTPISSGTSSHRTPKGSFKVTQKNIDHKSSLYGVIKNKATGEVVNADADSRKHRPKAGEVFVNAPMEYFLRFNGAIGMHKGHLPGYPASHGCVRLPGHMAKVFFENATYGTPVIVE